jgi:dipeptidyl-peptidase-4
MIRCVLALVLFGLVLSICAQKKAVTLDFVTNDADRVAADVWSVWCEDHILVLINPSSGGFERLDPASGKRTPLGDAATLMRAFGAAGAQVGSPPEPDAMSADGRHAAFIINEALFVADLAANTVSKVDSGRFAMQNALFSPNCLSLAYAKDNDLYVYSINGRSSARLTGDGRKSLLNGVLTWMYWEEIYNHHDQAYWWSPDSKYIAYLKTDESNVPPSIIVDFQPQYPRALTQCYPKPGNPNPTVKLGIVPATGGAVTLLDPLRKADGYIVGVKWGVRGQDPYLMYQVLNRAQTQTRVEAIPESNLSDVPKTLFSEADPKYIDVNDDFDFLGSDEFLFASGRSGYEQLYKISPDADARPQLLTKGEWQILPGEIFDPTTVVFLDQRQRNIYFTGDKESFKERALYRIKFDGSDLERITKLHGTHSVKFSPDGQYYTDSFSNRSTPPTVSICRADGTPVETLAKPDESVLDSVLLSPEKEIEITARDGFKLPATLRLPRDVTPQRKYPAIIEVYGGPEAPTVNDAWNYGWAEDQLLTENGFVVLHVDNRSSTVINRHLADAVKGHFYDGSERSDFVDAALWLGSLPEVDPTRIGIMGWSGGGGNVLNCMCRSTEFKAGMAGAPYLDPSFYDSFYSEHLYGLPKEDPEAYAEAPIWKDAKNLHGKLLMMWGTGDDNVHNQQELKFVDELISARKTVQIMIFPMRKHGLGDPLAERERTLTLLEFFKANL